MEERQGDRGGWRRWWPVWALALAHGLLAGWLHWGRSWQGDEWGSVLALSEPYGVLLTRFSEWYTMNFYLAMLKVLHGLGAENWGLVAPSLLAGMAVVVLTAGVVRRLGGGRWGMYLAAALAAANPYLLTYSVTIRSYALTAALLAAAIWLLLRWRERRGWREAVWFGLCANGALLMNLNAVYPLAGLAVIALVWAWVDREVRRGLWRLGVVSGVMLACVVAAYWPQMEEMARFRAMWSDTPPVALTFVPELMARWFGRGWLAFPGVGALLFSAWWLVRERSRGQVLLGAMVVAVAAISLAGVSHFPHAYARFLIGVVPWMLAAMALGLSGVQGRWTRAGAMVLAGLVVVCGLMAFVAERRQQHDRPWREMAESINAVLDGGNARAVVLGNDALVAALKVHGAESRSGFARMLGELPAEERTTVLLLDVTGGFDAAPMLELGALRLYRFEGRPREIAQQFLAGPVRSTREVIRPELTALYQQSSRVMRWLDRPADAARHDALRNASMLMEERTRTRPAQMLRPAEAR